MNTPLTTNGLVPSEDFPVGPYEEVHRLVVSRWASHELYEHYAGAWNAVAYRFHATVQAGDEFEQSLDAHGSAPPSDERYRQDQALANFFSNGFSTFESIFYGLHTIAAFVDPANFSLATPKARQQVSPTQTSATFKRAFPNDPILVVLETLFSDPAYQEWREIRNILVHRTAPGRQMYVGIGSDDAPETEWKLNKIPLDSSMVRGRRIELSRVLNSLLGGVAVFVDQKARPQP